MNGSSPNLNSAAPLLGNLNLNSNGASSPFFLRWFLKYLSWQKPKGLNLSNRRRLHPEMASFSFALQVNGLFHNRSISHSFDHLKTLHSSTVKVRDILRKLMGVSRPVGTSSNYMLQKNFTPVEEIGEAVQVVCIEGIIPVDFRAGVCRDPSPR
ncbi:hypothetical protein CK203_090937 [Vitis vinifera]|uniref:Uncharacterized protein n=1 Tax=Vitis vinifera TaxID=29760 RepID=A0A438DRT9_VITVI|nr:hypothetical protein CK203_090937 [Vitis vinifera]